ncbi:MAG TPA: ABC transporter substrate-binding protein [Pseudolabrys sp.]|nr:ABC transporter substrate-binding protein [Pseudolabrys sp.]
MRRRDFITLLGGATAWPLAARAQQSAQVRHIGALMNIAENDPEAKVWAPVFERALEKYGWKNGGNLRIEYRWANNDSLYKRFARELAGLNPEAILAVSGSSASALQEATGAIPIVFMATSDPVSRRLITSMEKPGSNITGFVEFEPDIGAKWLDLLKQVAPNVTRVAVVHDPMRSTWTRLLSGIQTAAPSFKVEISPVDARESAEVERVLTNFAGSPNGGLIVTPNQFSALGLQRLIALAARLKLPAVYFSRFFVAEGGLMSYAPDMTDQYQRAAGYIDRILKGEKPADMPVQTPAKFELVVNLRTAQVIGLTVPAQVLAAADHVIR